MLKNLILLSLRRFFRNKANSFLNIFGLSLGIIVYLLILIYVSHEFSYDNFHKDSDHVFRLIKENPPSESNYEGKSKQAVLPGPLADVIKTQIAGVAWVTRMANWGNVVVETEGKTFYEDSFYAADPDLFKIFTFEAVDGQRDQALQNPKTVAISETIAIKYFGTTQAVGKVLDLTSFKQIGEYTVDVVFKDFPSNSSYQFNIILRFVDFVTTVQANDLVSWNNWNYNFWLKIDAKTNPHEVEAQIKQFFIKKDAGNYDEENKKTNYLLEPIRDIYLKSDVNFSYTPKNDINRLYMLATIALFVLAVAGINYVNLTTARSVKRAKEVGIRKVSGAYQSTLIFQFLTDALAISTVSMIVALGVTWAVFPAYRDFIGKPLPLNFGDPVLLLSILCIPVLLGLFAGIYPALVLSSFKPVKVLKGNFGHSQDGNVTRDVLTVFQFAISGCLIIGVFVIGQQLSYIENHNPGYDRDHILKLELMDTGVREKRDVFVAELQKHPNIISTSVATYFPNSVDTQQGRDWRGPNGTTKVAFYTTHVDYNYLDLFNIQLIKGRNFSPDNKNDKNAFIINETAAKAYGWSDPVGMQFIGERDGGEGDTVHIIGVIKDIHISSYRRPIVPFRIGLINSWARQVAIKIKSTDLPATLSYIEDNYKKLATTKLPYKISFFDEDFGKVYKTDRQLGKLINLFSIVAVFIACLGLYGLAVHTTSQRMKEIGIRKILGAEFLQITYMLSQKFVLLVLIAFVIACPLAWYVMNQWLNTFVYHVSLGFAAFLGTAATMILIALMTVGSQTWRAATSNPTEILRSE